MGSSLRKPGIGKSTGVREGPAVLSAMETSLGSSVTLPLPSPPTPAHYPVYLKHLVPQPCIRCQGLRWVLSWGPQSEHAEEQFPVTISRQGAVPRAGRGRTRAVEGHHRPEDVPGGCPGAIMSPSCLYS